VRLLHTSDWHLGKLFKGSSMLDEQAAAIDRIVGIAADAQVDLVVIAGDLYDRSFPPAEAVELFDDALVRLRDTGAHVVAISGNHDSPARVGCADRLLERVGVSVRADAARAAEPVVVPSRDGASALRVYPVPYLEPAMVRHLVGPEDGADPVPGRVDHQRALAWAADRARADHRRHGGTSVVVAHAFVTSGGDEPERSESERDLAVGGSGHVDAAVFAGFDYVALGHLHGRQSWDGGRVAYSGTPLPYSFSEERHRKSVNVVELGSNGTRQVEQVELHVGLRLRTVTGDLEDLLVDPLLTDAEDARVRAVLTDRQLPPQAMQRLRVRFAHVAELQHRPPAPEHGAVMARPDVRVADPLDLTLAFLTERWGTSPDEPTRDLVTEVVDAALGATR
jgi:DNA repair protein SbcD/Mre11